MQCGSNNLTRPGYSSNLELLNALDFDLPEKADGQAIRMAQEAFRFFRAVLDLTPSRTRPHRPEWLSEFEFEASWLAARVDEGQEPVRLLATHRVRSGISSPPSGIVLAIPFPCDLAVL